MNRVLARQLRRVGLDQEQPPADPSRWAQFLDRVGAFYDEADRSRYLLERAIELSSREMLQLHRRVESLMSKRVELSEKHYSTLFHQLPVGAIEEDFTKAVARLEALRVRGITDIDAYFDANPTELDACIAAVDAVDCNSAAADLLRVPDRAMLIGPFDARGISESARTAWKRQFSAIWNKMGWVVVDFTGRRFDGSDFSVNLHWTAATYDGVIEYGRVMVVLIDISERIAAEQRMKDLVRSKDEFLASVSHELRTPLTSVIGFADLLGSADIPDDERAHMLQTIADQAADLSDIVEDLLVGARSEVGQLVVRSEAVDVAALIDGLRTSSSSVQSSIDQVELPKGPIVALADPARVRQILRNLLSNALRYGGSRVAVRVVCEGAAIRIAVCDDGGPLATDVASHIFDRYFRSGSVGDQPGSVGIGLTISRDLARLMGGDLTYHHDGSWSVFELTLPSLRSEAAA